MHYDYIVTGASGTIGRSIIPMLVKDGKRVLALGRDPTILHQLYSHLPRVDQDTYDSTTQDIECATLIHLAVRNNDSAGSLADFVSDNLSIAALAVEWFVKTDGQRFINISSIHTLGPGQASAYALSKSASLEFLKKSVGVRLDNIYIGYFYSTGNYGRRFSLLNRAGKLGDLLFSLVRILKPASAVHLAFDYIVNPYEHDLPDLVLTDDQTKNGPYRWVVRLTDIVAGLSVLTALSPLAILTWLLIRLDSDGSAFFCQKRVGKAGKVFTLYKFRTMRMGTANVGTHCVSESAITRIGLFLRKTKLDELPQALNLLLGNMTLVGPRPCLPSQGDVLDARRDFGVFDVKPGITGYAQVTGVDMSRPQDLAQRDYVYVKLQSLVLNARLILLTAIGRGSGDRIVPSKTPMLE